MIHLASSVELIDIFYLDRLSKQHSAMLFKIVPMQ